MDVTNPATGKQAAEYDEHGDEDVEAALRQSTPAVSI